MKYSIATIFLIGILLWVQALNADIYSWTDENGVKHFGNQPPDNATDAKMVFKEEPYNAEADRQRTAKENRELTETIRNLEEEEQRQAAEDRKRAAEAEQNKEPTRNERIEAEKERLETKIAELEAKPLKYFGSEKIKLGRIGYYRNRLKTLNTDPDKYFSQPTKF